MIIVAGKTIQEVKEQLAIIERLAAAGHQCGVGGYSLTEVQEGLRKVLGDTPIPFTNPNLVPPNMDEYEECEWCNGCCCEEEQAPDPRNLTNASIMNIYRLLRG